MGYFEINDFGGSFDKRRKINLSGKLLENDFDSIIEENAKSLYYELKSNIEKYGKISSSYFNLIYYLAFSQTLREMGVEENYEKEIPLANKIIEKFEESVEKAYKEKGLIQDSSNDQTPDFIIVSNTEINLNHIFYDSLPHVNEKIQVEGVFGSQENIRKEGHLNQANVEKEDFSQFAYMVNHLSHHNKEVPFVMFLGEKIKEGKTDLQLIAERRKRFIEMAKLNGNLVIEGEKEGKNFDYAVVREINNKEHFIMLPLVIYFPEKGVFKVYKSKGKDAGSYIKLKDWLYENKELIGEELVKKLAKKLYEHEKDRYSHLIHKIRRFYQKFNCVDARHQCYIPAEIVKELGSIPSEEEIRRAFNHNFAKKVNVELHYPCGYITTFLKFGLFFDWLYKEGEEELKEAIKIQLEEMLDSYKRNKPYIMKLSKEFDRMIREDKKDVYKMLFKNDKGDYQYILWHMINKGLLKYEEGYLKAKLVENIKNMEEGKRVYELTKRIGFRVLEQAKRIREEEIENGNINAKNIDFVVSIRDFRSGEVEKLGGVS